MSNQEKRIEILTKSDLRNVIKRLTTEILEKVNEPQNLILMGIPTRGVNISEVLALEIFKKTGFEVAKGIIDPTFYRDDQSKVGTKSIKVDSIPDSLDDKDIILIDDVIYTGRTARAAMEALNFWGRPQKIMLLVMIDRGHRELPIQPDFCGKQVFTNKGQNIELRLSSLDKIEGVFLV
tara:strand:- start:1617 stop:2153 length:537 start_codon:yes stop_codon:yes gene_type:complete